MDIELVPLATVTITGAGIIPVGTGPAGDRMVGEVEAVDVRGDRLNAHMRGRAAADWLTVSAAAVASPDVRITLETHDGAVIYVTYQGRCDLSGGWGDAQIYVAPRFETSDERYAWLNVVQAVGKGRFAPPGVLYEWYELR